jgi:hypothetical protein
MRFVGASQNRAMLLVMVSIELDLYNSAEVSGPEGELEADGSEFRSTLWYGLADQRS